MLRGLLVAFTLETVSLYLEAVSLGSEFLKVIGEAVAFTLEAEAISS